MDRSLAHFSHSCSVWWLAPRTISQTREALKPAWPTNSWDAPQTMTQHLLVIRIGMNCALYYHKKAYDFRFTDWSD